MPAMTISDPKADLRRYLQQARDAMLWKLDGLSEYDARRPLTPTGTNLLGLVKHLTGCEIGYFGATFGRPLADPPVWVDDELLEREPMTDMWATADEPRDHIVGWYRKAWAHADVTFDTLDLDAVGQVPWWPGEHGEVDLHRILVHMIAETHRHAGQADIVRELMDGAAGLRAEATNLPDGDQAWWSQYRATVEQAARTAAGPAGPA
jgi:uncharacterized damage-inducible protein DinB